MMTRQLTKEERQYIFSKLLEEQDAGTGLDQSRQRLSGEFQLSVAELIAIEQQGRLRQWPPLT